MGGEILEKREEKGRGDMKVAKGSLKVEGREAEFCVG
jgi:hypothetical protein